jgi:hypothetical protein
MLNTVYAFDFDGTITDIPGENSEIYLCGTKYCKLNPEFIYIKLKDIIDRYIPKSDVDLLKDFFNVLSNEPNTIITIQTRNYCNVVKACLFHHIGLAENIFDLDRSCFRESYQTKINSLDQMTRDPNIGCIFFFDDTISYIKEASVLTKVKTIHCDNGKNYLGQLLTLCPVFDKKSLEEFLSLFAK